MARPPLVLVLLLPVRMFARIALACVCLLSATPTLASERTFIFSPAELAGMVDGFNARVIAQSATFAKQVRLHGNTVRFFGRACPTLGTTGYAASRVRVLDGATRAASLASRTPNLAFGAALQSLGAVGWSAPATARTRQPSWVVETAPPGAVGFTTSGFASGNPAGTIGATTDGRPTFLVQVDLTAGGTSDPVALVLALTTELPPTRPGRMPKRSECYLVGASQAADVQALADLLAATPLADLTRSRLENILADAFNWLDQGRPQRAARAAKRFALEVAGRSGSEIPADAAEAMITRALLVTDALGL